MANAYVKTVPQVLLPLPKMNEKQKYIGTYYTVEELRYLLEHVRGESIEVPVMLAAWLGVRRGEAIGLRWGDIDQNEKVITVCRVVTRVAKGEYMPVERTKNGKVRQSPTVTNSLHASNRRKRRASMSCRLSAADT